MITTTYKPAFLLKVIFSAIVSAAMLSYAAKPAGKILSYTVDLKKQDLRLYWKDDAGKIIGSLQNLKSYVESKNETLIFAANGGMYQKDQSPLGLFVARGKTLSPLNKRSGNGNFYIAPNGIFWIAGQKCFITTTAEFKQDSDVDYATQSGPMLVINGKIHPDFKQGSTNLNIRNGVGILPDGKVLFAMSEREINFYDFAEYFQDLGCENALYLDGFVSRTYLPEKNWVQADGSFGVMIGVTQKKTRK